MTALEKDRAPDQARGGKPLGRLPDWEQRLTRIVAANAARPHAFGRWDCLLWPAAAVKAVTGADLGRGHRGKYRSMAGAYRHLGTMGFASPEALLDSLFEKKPVGFAQRGDLVLVSDDAAAEIPGVCMGDFALCIGDDGEAQGLARVARARWLKAWSVEDSALAAPSTPTGGRP